VLAICEVGIKTLEETRSFVEFEAKLLSDSLQCTASPRNQIGALGSLMESQREFIVLYRWLFSLWCIASICVFGRDLHFTIIIVCLIGIGVAMIGELGDDIVEMNQILNFDLTPESLWLSQLKPCNLVYSGRQDTRKLKQGMR
jgi:hypothetical protein